ncbi:MAG: hypothetical protein HY796_01520 [Elusimicrobia bacterium]|nr:hypothetical protein [Elusimicrobiota bacterium]
MGFKLERGWETRHKAGNGGELLVQKSGPGPIFIRWYLSKSRKLILLPSTPIMHQRRGAAIVAHRKRKLIYWREQGIVGYNLTAKKEKVLVALDSDLFRAGQFWLNENEDILYFIREKYSPPWDTILNVLKKQEKAPILRSNIHCWLIHSTIMRAG